MAKRCGVVMVKRLPSYFYIHKLENSIRILENFTLWKSVEYSISYSLGIQYSRLSDLHNYTICDGKW